MQEDEKFKVILGDTEILKAAWNTLQPVSKNKQMDKGD